MSSRGRAAAISVALAALTAATYWPVDGNEFINIDDPAYLTKNPHVQGGLSWAGLEWALTTTHSHNWHPLTWLSHMLDCELYGLAPGPHHLTNVALHVANAVLLFAVMRRLSGAVWPSAFVAGLFALHPQHVESVAWAAERKDVLSTLFWMLTLLAYVAYTKAPGRGRYALVLLLFGLGLTAKPTLVTLPFVLLLLDWWPLRRSTPPGRLVVEKIPLLLLTVASCIATVIAQRTGAIAPFEVVSMQGRVENAIVSYARYIAKAVWPMDLAILYPHPGTWPAWTVVGAGAMLLGTTALVIRVRARHPYLGVGWLWYLGTLVPMIGLVQVGAQAMADRFAYVSTIGLCIMVAWGVPALAPRGAARRPLLIAAAIFVLVACAVLTRQQVAYWQNSVTLLSRSLAVSGGSFIVHNNLGSALMDRGDLGEAAAHLRESIRLMPASPKARNNLAGVLHRQGRTADAIRMYEEALRLAPSQPLTHYNMGTALLAVGRNQEAIASFNEALRYDPGYAEAHNNLGVALYDEGNLDAALAHYEEALRLQPDHALARRNRDEIVLLQRLVRPDR